MLKITLSLIAVFMVAFVYDSNAQRNYDLYWVGFKSKASTSYSIYRPEAFLSARALDRRMRQGIQIDSLDLPVSPSALNALVAMGGEIHGVSKWLNGAVVKLAGGEAALRKLNFVKTVEGVGFSRAVGGSYVRSRTKRTLKGKDEYKRIKYFYGKGNNQITMLNGHYLHKMGAEGQSMQVAVLDGGFTAADKTPCLDSLFLQGRVLGTHDFVEGDDYVYEGSSHGRDVLSTMASDLPYLMVGTAPQASYYLFKTEDSKGEYRIEEYNWIFAVEHADSLGVDVINSSLGYYDFDDDKMDYAYADINGTTAPSSRAANIASDRGMLLVTSAGNAGNDKWKHITVPADAPGNLTVGAVDYDGYYARFSSRGFENAALVKPNVVARGAAAIVANPYTYSTRPTNGTSFSSPIMAGMAASLWGSLPQLTNKEIKALLQQVGHQSNAADTYLGYGIPDFKKAYEQYAHNLVEITSDVTNANQYVGAADALHLFMEKSPYAEVRCRLVNPEGTEFWSSTSVLKSFEDKKLWHQSVPVWNALEKGVYLLLLESETKIHRIKLVR